MSVGLWFTFTTMLAAFFRFGSSFGETYGPLAGVVALLLWSLMSSIALLLGAATGSQLEAVRAGRLPPQDEEKVLHSEPGTAIAEPGPNQLMPA